MRTNIELDDKLMSQAFKHAPTIKTKRELVDLALREYVARRTRPNVLDLVGKKLIDPDYDYKASR